ncbi:hypothetical protein [Brevibacterium sp.]|uniref:hypothetical protein n=1 Tax=Brevibacterium sp. TaxID=1701 RepID=UPI0025C2A83C|nr:hypothetical protein [Brevibacterium sp.]
MDSDSTIVAADLPAGTWFARAGEPATICRAIGQPYAYSRNKVPFRDCEVWGQRSDGRVQVTRKRADVPVRRLDHAEVIEALAAQQRRTLRAGVLVPEEAAA